MVCFRDAGSLFSFLVSRVLLDSDSESSSKTVWFRDADKFMLMIAQFFTTPLLLCNIQTKFVWFVTSSVGIMSFYTISIYMYLSLFDITKTCFE